MAFPRKLLALAACALLAACSAQRSDPASEGVTDAMLANPPDGEWLNHGRDAGEQRFSPLTGISEDNVGELGLAWFADLDTARGQEATPLMHGGVLYVSTAWSMVKAYDARNGALKWSYDPKVPRETLARSCCDAVNRGVALYGDRVYVATLDGRLVALDQASGKVLFERMIVPNQRDYVITSAPRIARGLVVIGSAGAEFKARGFIAAFDWKTGEEVWRFHTVPGDPAKGFENEAMERAAKTWSGEWWKLGGGGTVWEGITYDPKTGLVLFGTGNAEPWISTNDTGKGDSLYTSSIVAVRADTGEYAWHFQQTPGDRWDYDSNAPITITDLTIDGRKRHVALHAPKNGYFYVLDAATGEFLSAGSYVPQSWTLGIDGKTGRPRINPEARYDLTGKMFMGEPSSMGGHSWQSMSFSPQTGLVYFPALQMAAPFATEKDWKPSELGFQTGVSAKLGAMAPEPDAAPITMNAMLLAWDPVAQKEAWRVSHVAPGNGGTLATAGNLVFQGATDGRFLAFRATDSKELWSFPAQSGMIAAPITYSLDGEQYVAILTGWGGAWGGLPLPLPSARNISRVLVFKLGAKGQLPPPPPMAAAVLDPPPFTGTSAQVERGSWLYGRYCYVCHGAAAVAGGIYPDLRHSAALNDAEMLRAIVLGGALRHNGMVSFKPEVGNEEVEAIRQYLIKRANDDMAATRRVAR